MSEMTKEAAAARIDQLRAVMKKNSYLYYVQDNPLITDAEYDAMMRELKKMKDEGIPKTDKHEITLLSEGLYL